MGKLKLVFVFCLLITTCLCCKNPLKSLTGGEDESTEIEPGKEADLPPGFPEVPPPE